MGVGATIVIPQYGRLDLTVSCLRSIRGREQHPWPIIVVDDGSPIPEEEIREELSPYDVELFFQEHSGVTASWNRGIREAGTELVVLLNNDVIFHDAVMERLLAPFSDARVLMTGVRFREERRLGKAILEGLPVTQFLEGWCQAFRKTSWECVGGFDESMKIYWSDTDFQLRLLQLAGCQEKSFRECEGLPVSHQGRRTTRTLEDRHELWRKDRDVFVNRWKK